MIPPLLPEVAQFMERQHNRLSAACGNSVGLHCYIGLNYLHEGDIYVRVGTRNDSGLRQHFRPTEFSWPAVQSQILAEVERIVWEERKWTPEEVGRTLGVIMDGPVAVAAE